MAPGYAMSCVVCGTPLADDGSCPTCGAGSAPPALPDAQVGRGHARLEPPPGGGLRSGRTDRLGVFQATGQRTNWFVRGASVVAAAIFALAVTAVIVVAIVALAGGVWILPTGGLGALFGVLIMLIGLVALLAIGAMLWLLTHPDKAPATGSYGRRRR